MCDVWELIKTCSKSGVRATFIHRQSSPPTLTITLPCFRQLVITITHYAALSLILWAVDSVRYRSVYLRSIAQSTAYNTAYKLTPSKPKS